MFGWMTGEMWLWMGIWILVLAVLVWALVREPRRPPHDEALDALRARLARGEIGPDEYQRVVQLLTPGTIGGQR